MGEVNHFETVRGTVKQDGTVAISIDLASVETTIDIRNERMMKFVFGATQATDEITGQIDMSEIETLEIGATEIVDFEGNLSFAGV